MSSSEQEPVYGSFFGAVGAASAMILCSFGSGYATAKSGASIATAATKDPAAIMRALLPVVMAGIICVYGLVAAVLIVNALTDAANGYKLYDGYLHFGSGFSVGFCGLFAGYAIGKIGEAGVLTLVQQNRFFIGMVLMLIFSEVIGLYGLIVGIILITK